MFSFVNIIVNSWHSTFLLTHFFTQILIYCYTAVMNELAVIGLGTMGANLARNAARNGATVILYNRTAAKTEAFMKEYASEGNFVPVYSYEDMAKAFSGPKALLLMVKAGKPVDAVLEDLQPFLTKGDIVIDGGNSHFEDTNRRVQSAEENGIHFIGMGVSGGEEGALNGPSMMPGGSKIGYQHIETLLQKMAADDDLGGKCVVYIGEGGAGHFVKTVHNGIEYGLMQLIAESYDFLKHVGEYSNEELAETFANWNEGEDLQSFLMEITAAIFTEKNEKTGELLDVIVDKAGQKGTGKWTTIAALDLGVAIPTINAAVDARIISGSENLRKKYQVYPLRQDLEEPIPPKQKLRSIMRSTLHLGSLSAYAQGFELIEAASNEYNWNLQISECARIWRGGCIIRSAQLQTFIDLYAKEAAKQKTSQNYLVNQFGADKQVDFRLFIQAASSRGIPTPAFSATLNYFDALRRKRLPQNLIQAQRDFFGAHTYERTDKKGTFHTEWGS